MNILALDTATNVATAAIMSKEKLICEMIVDHDLNHSRTLLPVIEQMLTETGLDFKDIDLYTIAVGPGSFTGLRIGLATVKGLCQVSGKNIIPVSTLMGLAYNISYANGIVCPMLDARRNQVYTALFRANGSGVINRLQDDMAKDVDSLTDWLESLNEPVYVLGEAAQKYQNILVADNVRIVKPYLCKNKASSLAAYALGHLSEQRNFRLIEPSYLRPSYAEEKKK